MLKTIKSFVRRSGRLSVRQQTAYNNWRQDYELFIDNIPWNIEHIFGRTAETIVEIGFGMGASLASMASLYSQYNFIGIEVHHAGIGSLTADLHDNVIANVRIVPHDAVEVFEKQLSPESIHGVQIFFPDPWHKKRHNKRRLIQPHFIKLLIKTLKPGGFIHIATDWEDYAQHIEAVLSSENHLTPTPLNGTEIFNSLIRPITKFEARGKRLGHKIWDLIYYKNS